ncbi:MAG: calcium/sodium antiporter [Patescibacteria group bacterium]
MMFITIITLIIGLAILIAGAEALVRGASSLARRLGITSLVIGLTVVAFGTSTPELFVNLYSSFKGASDIAIGNIIGSNIANILLILGLSAIIAPLAVKKNTVWKEIPFALLAVVLVFLMGNDALFDKVQFNELTRTDGFALIAIFIIFMYYIVSIAKAGGNNEGEVKMYSLQVSLMCTIGGIAALAWGGKLLVDGAIILARLAGMSEALIGLTIVAVGTSLPELATSVVAAFHNADDIAVGNIVGSNIFNVFWVLGVTSLILPLPFNIRVNVDVGVSIIATFLLFFAMFIGKRHKLERWQGVWFVLLYGCYLGYLIMRG